MNFPNFITFYKSENSFYTYNYETTEFKIVDNLTNINMNNYELLSGYVKSKNELVRFSEDLIKWRNELLDASNGKIDYFEHFIMADGANYHKNHFRNTKRILNMLMTNKDIYNSFPVITLQECEYFENCYNSYLSYQKEGVYDNITTYDKRMFYPTILGCDIVFQIPKVEGKIGKINVIPNGKYGFKYGIYHVKVISNDPSFNKVFAFNKKNYYTHYCLNFVQWYNYNYTSTDVGGNGKVEMKVLSKECLKWNNKDDLIQGTKLFAKWYHTLKDYKQKYPQNKIIKRLTSAAWGCLSKNNVIVKSEDEILNDNLQIGTSLNVEDNRYYIKEDMMEKLKLIDLTKPIYQFQIRLKPFLLSYARVMMAKIALENIDNVIRIKCDSITYDRKITVNKYEFIKEQNKSDCKAKIEGNQLIIL